MRFYRFTSMLLAALFILTGTPLLLTPQTAVAQEGTLTIHSRPDAAALYLGDMAYIRDTVTIPAGMDAQIILPRTVVPDSLILTENNARVRNYSYRETSPEQPMSISLAATDSGTPREVVLAYLASGAGWRPLYDMDVLAEDQVQFGFDVQIYNRALELEEIDLRLVAGMAGADPNYRPDMTVTQMNVLYNDPGAPAAVGGPVEINHVYEIGTQTIAQGEVLHWNVAYETLDARRLIVWDARFGQRTDVIFKVMNSTDVPFVAGPVHGYEDGLYVGQDQIEWTPSGSEGSVTIAGLSSVRVRKTESVEQIGSFIDDRYSYTVTLSITNHGGEAINLTVLDEWNRAGQNFQFSHEPTRQGNNVLRWELEVAAGESTEITYTFIID